ncbi:MAG: aldehyde dehydrogenase family protein [Planctomycetaceae bacterium]
MAPVVGVMPVRSDEEAISLMNDSPYGLSASIWTEDIGAAEQIGNELETGTVFLSRCATTSTRLSPGQGVKETGRGITLRTRLLDAHPCEIISPASGCA